MCATIEITTQILQNHIRSTLEYLTPLLGMANAPMVSYITDNLWKKHVPMEIQQEIQISSDIESAVNIFWTHLNEIQNTEESADKFKHFRAFLSSNKQYQLDSHPDIWISPQRLKQILDSQRNYLPMKGFMSHKKNHEVHSLLKIKMMKNHSHNVYISVQVHIVADVIACMCAPSINQNALGVIEAGDGKGYLSTQLSLEYSVKVLGLDCNPVNTIGALLRSEKLEVHI